MPSAGNAERWHLQVNRAEIFQGCVEGCVPVALLWVDMGEI